jgi:glycosyltransferase involved in cell wall biosynthesis
MPKVLHVVENLDRGAVENWLVRMLQHAARRGTKLAWTFYCTLPLKGALEDEALAAGARVAYAPVTVSSSRQFIAALRQELQSGGYDVLHCHHDLMSAVYLLSALGTPVGRRIVHVHNADEALPTPSIIKQRLLREPMRRTCLALADRIVGISHHTLDTFLAGRSRRKGRDSVHYYGVNSVPHTAEADDRLRFRRELGFADDALVFLFGGRLVPEKNSIFVPDIFASLQRMEPRAVCVFAGAGSQEGAVLARTRALGVESATRLLGWRTDLARIMSCSDWFVLPRPEAPMEGFGLAVLEAQLAGLRMLLSRGIPDDPLLPTARYRRLALAAGPDAWARAAIELLQEPAPSQQAAIDALAQSPMDMDFALEDLLGLYR